jgi:hypothetical protein
VDTWSLLRRATSVPQCVSHVSHVSHAGVRQFRPHEGGRKRRLITSRGLSRTRSRLRHRRGQERASRLSSELKANQAEHDGVRENRRPCNTCEFETVHGLEAIG